jgi:Tol biopolymer transport system component
MDEERIEQALRQGPPDEPAYERSIATQVETTSADIPDDPGTGAAYQGAIRRAGVAPRFGFGTLVAAVVVLAVSLAVVRLPAIVGPGSSTPLDESWIAFEGPLPGDGIFLVRPDGVDLHALLPDARYDALHPDWSPDGARIAFDAATAEGNEIWVVNADGTNAAAIVRRSTDCAISCGDVALPAWSPDGSKLAFVRYQFGPSGLKGAVIEVQDIASGDRRVLYTAPSKTALNYPRWSSDGRSIVFEMTRYPDTQINHGTATGSAIAVIDVTGAGARPVVLTDWSMYATYPDWRPGSDEILFSTYDLDEFQATDEPSNLYTIKPDGSGLTALTTFGQAGQRATQPTWTPDGSRIIFTLVGHQAGVDNPLQAAFIQGNGSNIVDIGVAATHPRLQPGTP